MKYTYEISAPERGGQIILRHEESGIAFIPFDEGNADYQQYLVDTDGGLPLPKGAK